MILSKRKATEKNWELILSSLQAKRGQGLWRGTFIQLRPKNQLRILLEALDSRPSNEEVSIYIQPKAEDIYADFSHREKVLRLKDFEMDVDNFLEEILKEVRQRTYIRTNKDKANYRDKTPNSSHEQ